MTPVRPLTLSASRAVGTRGAVSRFSAVLADRGFPLRRWELLAIADDYGLDSRSRTEIEQIPDRTYGDAGEVMAALSNTPAHLSRRAPL